MDRATEQMMPGAKTVINGYKDAGNEILIFTSRPDYDRWEIERWLNRKGIPFDDIQCGKPYFNVLIDDHAEYFDGWGKDYLQHLQPRTKIPRSLSSSQRKWKMK